MNSQQGPGRKPAWAFVKWLFDPTIVAALILVGLGGSLLARNAERDSREHEVANLKQIFLVEYTRSIAALTSEGDRLGELPALWRSYQRAPADFRPTILEDIKTIHQRFNETVLESVKAHYVLSGQLRMLAIAEDSRSQTKVEGTTVVRSLDSPEWNVLQLATMVKTASNKYSECCFERRARQEEGVLCRDEKDQLVSRLETLQACISSAKNNRSPFCPDFRPPTGAPRLSAAP